MFVYSMFETANKKSIEDPLSYPMKLSYNVCKFVHRQQILLMLIWLQVLTLE